MSSQHLSRVPIGREATALYLSFLIQLSLEGVAELKTIKPGIRTTGCLWEWAGNLAVLPGLEADREARGCPETTPPYTNSCSSCPETTGCP